MTFQDVKKIEVIKTCDGYNAQIILKQKTKTTNS